MTESSAEHRLKKVGRWLNAKISYKNQPSLYVTETMLN